MTDCIDLKWDLSMLSGCPQLKSFRVFTWHCPLKPTGELNDLRVLRNTLEVLVLSACHEVRGNFMDLADFPRLRWLDLLCTSIVGDIRDIGRDDFLSIETRFLLPRTVVGGRGYEFQRISDVPSFMESIHPLLKRKHIFDSYFYQDELN